MTAATKTSVVKEVVEVQSEVEHTNTMLPRPANRWGPGGLPIFLGLRETFGNC